MHEYSIDITSVTRRRVTNYHLPLLTRKTHDCARSWRFVTAEHYHLGGGALFEIKCDPLANPGQQACWNRGAGNNTSWGGTGTLP